MKGLLDLLARAKLVELSEDEKLTTPAMDIEQAGAASGPIEAPADPPPPPLSASELAVEEGRAFEAIFESANVPTTPFPAEKLLRLLDGLRAMDSATRKAAVLAMDEADDGWQIADCVADAQHKISALGGYKQRLAAQLQGQEQQAATRLASVRSELETATAAIRQQIAELEQLLERKITQSAQEETTIEAEMRSAREAVAREIRRADAEIDRFHEIPAQFSAAPAAL